MQRHDVQTVKEVGAKVSAIDGFFKIDLRRIVFDLFGRKPEFTTVGGRRYQKIPRSECADDLDFCGYIGLS